MNQEKRIDLGLAKLLAKEEKSINKKKTPIQSPEKQELKPRESESISDKLEVDFIISSELEQLLFEKKWLEVAQLCEKKISEDKVLAPYYRSVWVASQVNLKTVPLSMLVAPLDSARKEYAEKYTDINSQRVNQFIDKSFKKSYASLAEGFKQGGDNKLFQHCLNLSGKQDDIFFDQAKFEQVEALEYESSNSSKRFFLLISIVLSALALVLFLYFYKGLFSKTVPLMTELKKSDQPIIELPNTERIGVLEHLDPILYDAKDTTNTSVSESVQSKSVKKELPFEVSQTQDELKDINTNSPVEPKKVFKKIMEGEPIPIETAKSEVSNIPLKPESKTKTFRIIAKTNILAQANYKAEIIAKLKPGQEVDVIEEDRVWLKLKAKSGKYGFILSQDAIPIKPTK